MPTARRTWCASAAAQTVLGRNRIKGISVSLSHDRTSATAVALAHPMAAEAPWLGRAAVPPAAAAAQGRPREPAARVRRGDAGRRDRGAGAGALRAHGPAAVGVPALPVAVGGAAALDGPRREPRRADRRARAGQGRADPDRSLRQLRGGDRRRARQLSAGARPLLVRAPAGQAGVARPAGDAPLRAAPASASCPSAAGSTRSSTSWRPATWWCSRSTSTPAARTACWWSSSAIPPARSAASPSSRCRPARRSCRLRAGASPTARTCCASRTALAPIEHADPNEAIRLNTRAYNAALEPLVVRHPEQWWWSHRRWKAWPAAARRRR